MMAVWIADLPRLQSVKLRNGAFKYVHSAVFESDGVDALMIQICRHFSPLTSGNGLFQAMKGRIGG